MNFTKTCIFVLAILAVVLESDLGRKKIGWFRIARPIIAAAAIVPVYFTNLPTGSNDLLLQGLAAVAGITLGLIVVSPLVVSVQVDTNYRSWWQRRRSEPGKPAAVSFSGTRYALIWIAFSLARLAFAYGSVHWFSHNLGSFLNDHSISSAALTNALIFLSVGMDVFRSIGLVARGSHALHRDTFEAQTSQA